MSRKIFGAYEKKGHLVFPDQKEGRIKSILEMPMSCPDDENYDG
jgi:hypothetical protein